MIRYSPSIQTVLGRRAVPPSVAFPLSNFLIVLVCTVALFPWLATCVHFICFRMLVFCFCHLRHLWKICTTGLMTHPASVGKESKMAFRQWKSMSHTARRSFGEERERHGKTDHDRQAEKMSKSQCTQRKVVLKKDENVLCKFCLGITYSEMRLLRKTALSHNSRNHHVVKRRRNWFGPLHISSS